MCPNSSLMLLFPLRHPWRLPETRLKAEKWRKKVIFLDSWCLKLFFITSHINSHLKFTFISPGWFTSQSFYTPNFIFHLTSLILFVNKAPLPSSISSQQQRFFLFGVVMGKIYRIWVDGAKMCLLGIDRFQVAERNARTGNFDKVEN